MYISCITYVFVAASKLSQNNINPSKQLIKLLHSIAMFPNYNYTKIFTSFDQGKELYRSQQNVSAKLMPKVL